MANLTSAAVLLPAGNTPLLDANGNLNTIWYRLLLGLYQRTGGAQGISSADVATLADTATTAANTAQASAVTANTVATGVQQTVGDIQTAVGTSQTTATTALTIADRLVSTVVYKTSFQSDGIAPSTNPTFDGTVSLIGTLVNAANDAAAAAAGVEVNQLYRNGSFLMIRVA